MAKVILDNRIHRTVQLSKGGVNVNIDSPSSGYKIYLTTDATGTNDTITLTNNSGTVSQTLPCLKTYKPPQCGTVISAITNHSCQWEMDVEPDNYRIVELGENLCDANKLILFAVSYGTPQTPINGNALMYAKTAVDSETPIDTSGLKVPPQMG
jgi:hypothetical protein